MVQTQSESESEDETSMLAQAIRQELSLFAFLLLSSLHLTGQGPPSLRPICRSRITLIDTPRIVLVLGTPGPSQTDINVSLTGGLETESPLWEPVFALKGAKIG